MYMFTCDDLIHWLQKVTNHFVYWPQFVRILKKKKKSEHFDTLFDQIDRKM